MMLDFIYGTLIKMNKENISTDRAPKAIGPYSQAVRYNNLIFSSGQIPIDVDNGEIVSNNFEDQVHQCLQNIKGILIEEGINITNIIKLTVYLIDISNFDKLNKIFEEFFEKEYPARSVVEVCKLPKDAQVEIEAIACYDL